MQTEMGNTCLIERLALCTISLRMFLLLSVWVCVSVYVSVYVCKITVGQEIHPTAVSGVSQWMKVLSVVSVLRSHSQLKLMTHLPLSAVCRCLWMVPWPHWFLRTWTRWLSMWLWSMPSSGRTAANPSRAPRPLVSYLLPAHSIQLFSLQE